jgi:hypothetical protein
METYSLAPTRAYERVREPEGTQTHGSLLPGLIQGNDLSA